MDSSSVSNPGSVRRIDALPGGSLKHTTLGVSPVAAASSSYEKPFRNALSMSKGAMIQSGWQAASLAKVRWELLLAVPENASRLNASRSWNPRSTSRSLIILVHPSFCLLPSEVTLP